MDMPTKHVGRVTTQRECAQERLVCRCLPEFYHEDLGYEVGSVGYRAILVARRRTL